MQLTFWGVRGSIPAPDRDAWRYGGNTPCLELRDPDGQLFILDAGTGIRELGRQLMAEMTTPGLAANLLFTHYHWDHVQGLPFFEPVYFQGNTLSLFGPRPQADAPSSLAGVLHALFRAPFFPVATGALRANLPLRELEPVSDFTVGKQPCATFREQDEGFGGNLHECFGPYGPGREAEERCGGQVSFCDNCSRDHHSRGWQTCPWQAK